MFCKQVQHHTGNSTLTKTIKFQGVTFWNCALSSMGKGYHCFKSGSHKRITICARHVIQVTLIFFPSVLKLSVEDQSFLKIFLRALIEVAKAGVDIVTVVFVHPLIFPHPGVIHLPPPMAVRDLLAILLKGFNTILLHPFWV